MRLVVRAQDLTWFSFALAHDKRIVRGPVRIKGTPETFFRSLVGVLERWSIGFQDLTSLAVVAGPGSYTALRGSLTVMNILAWTKNLSICSVQARQEEEDVVVFQRLARARARVGHLVVPAYGAAPKITKPKK